MPHCRAKKQWYPSRWCSITNLEGSGKPSPCRHSVHISRSIALGCGSREGLKNALCKVTWNRRKCPKNFQGPLSTSRASTRQVHPGPGGPAILRPGASNPWRISLAVEGQLFGIATVYSSYPRTNI